ncbi:putative uncharacterized protein [Burkholderiales bacterium GJ-E10]|nr:putative uncharacterized protein [Burkholderiales bacterium GJ-E10]
MRNPRRDAVLDALRAEFDRALRADRAALLIAGQQLVNAVWFAALWTRGFKPVVATVIWAAFFLVCLAWAVRIERGRR